MVPALSTSIRTVYIYDMTVASLGLLGCLLIAAALIQRRSRTVQVWVVLLMCFFYGLTAVTFYLNLVN